MIFFGYFCFFFFNDTATTEIYTLSLHDALPPSALAGPAALRFVASGSSSTPYATRCARRSEEHTSELQSPCNLVCRLLLEKKNNKNLILFTIQKKKLTVKTTK